MLRISGNHFSYLSPLLNGGRLFFCSIQLRPGTSDAPGEGATSFRRRVSLNPGDVRHKASSCITVVLYYNYVHQITFHVFYTTPMCKTKACDKPVAADTFLGNSASTDTSTDNTSAVKGDAGFPIAKIAVSKQ